MNKFKALKKLFLLPLAVAALLYGCFFFDDDVEKGSSTHLVGFASDTTAILFRYNWEETEKSLCTIGHRCISTDYLDLELKLVDVRFYKVYWESRIKNNYAKFFWTSQWSDSTIFINQNMLWTIGESKPREVNFSLEGDGFENFDKTLDLQIPPHGNIFKLYDDRRQWKNETILMRTYWKERIPEYVLLDRKNFVISLWQPSAEERELAEKGAVWDGEKFIYLENECKSENMFCYPSYNSNLCKCPETLEPCKAFVISGNGDTLHTVGHYPYIERRESFGDREVDKRCGFEFSFGGNIISIQAINKSSDGYYKFTLPSALLPRDTSNISNIYGLGAMIFIDKSRKELLNPSFWNSGNLRFVDSLGNITEY